MNAGKPLVSKRHKTPTVLQIEALECGAASLSMILAYYGRWVTLEELRLKCGVSRDGCRASNILKAARGFGVNAKGFKKEPADLRTMPLPMIVFWNFNHYVVLEGFKGGKVYLNDPAAGPKAISEEEFDQSFTGVALTFEPGPDFQRGGQPKSMVAALKRRFVGTREALAYLVLVGVALVLPGLVVPVLTSVFIDKVMVSGLHDWLAPLLLGLVITSLMRMVLTWLESYYLLRVRTQLAMSSAGKFFWHVLRMPVGFFTQRSPGEISSRVEINDRVASMLSGELARSMLALLQVIFFGAMMFFYDVYLTLISVTCALLDILVMRWVATKMMEISQKISLNGGKVYSATMNGLEVMETIKSTGGESGFFAHWAGTQAKYVTSEQERVRAGLIVGAIPELLTALSAMLMLGVGGMRVVDGHLTIGMLVAFLSLAASFSAPVEEVVGLGKQILDLKGDINRLDDVLQYPQDPWHLLDDAEAAKHADQKEQQKIEPIVNPSSSHGSSIAAMPPSVTHAKFEGRIEMTDVTFGYTPAGTPLIENFNLMVEPGERVAIVGPSGCGKSTVSRLLMGLYEPWSGEIKFDDKRRMDYPRQVFFSSVALVDQDVVLFEGSVRDNLTMWDTTVSDQDMIQAAKDACIHDFIMSRPGGYESPIEEGGQNMSGGQRQRFEIARALATNPRVVVMDEGTSALDPTTERLIDQNLRRRGCSCVIIAHRLSTIRDADEIIVLSSGHIVERGPHEELLENPDGFYTRLISQI